MAVPWELTASAFDRLLLRLDSGPGPRRRRLRGPAPVPHPVLRLARRALPGRVRRRDDEPAGAPPRRGRRRRRHPRLRARHRPPGAARAGAQPAVAAGRAGRAADRAGARVDRDPEPRLHDCLETCLASLPADARTLILEYYQDQRRQKIDRRVRLATQLGLSANALRSRAQRVRDRLERCVRACAAGPADDTKPGAAHLSRGDAAGDRPRAATLRQTDDAP